MSSSLTFEPLEEDLNKILSRTFPLWHYLRCGGTVVTANFMEIAEDILNMEVREDDIWICTYPKSGTSWTIELTWLIANDLDFDGANVSQMLRFRFLEMSQYFRPGKENGFNNKGELEIDPRVFTNSVDYVKEMKSPRFIKTHVPFHLLPLQLQRGDVKPKIIHVHRNPMDTCISYYHHNKLTLGYEGSLEDFATLFVKDISQWGPFWKHYLGYLDKEKEFNILYLKFEEMKKDLSSVVRKTAAFLNKTLNDQQVDMLCDYLSFRNMKNNPFSNNDDMVRMVKMYYNVRSEGNFMRCGESGQWRSTFDQDWVNRFKKWSESSLEGTGLYSKLSYF